MTVKPKLGAIHVFSAPGVGLTAIFHNPQFNLTSGNQTIPVGDFNSCLAHEYDTK